MKKIWHLENCDTCQRIIGDLGGLHDFEKQNIKVRNISAEELDWIREKTGSYEALFSKNAMKYKTSKLKDQNLTEQDYRNYILQEYTFLKRPVIVDGEEIFVGNAPKTVEAARQKINK